MEHSHFPIGLKELEKLLEGAHVSGVTWPWGSRICVSSQLPPACLSRRHSTWTASYKSHKSCGQGAPHSIPRGN